MLMRAQGKVFGLHVGCCKWLGKAAHRSPASADLHNSQSHCGTLFPLPSELLEAKKLGVRIKKERERWVHISLPSLFRHHDVALLCGPMVSF